MEYKNRLRIKGAIYLLAIPFYVLVFCLSHNKNILKKDLLKLHKKDKANGWAIISLLSESLLMTRSFRNIYYLRCGFLSLPLSLILKPVPNVELSKHIKGEF